MTTTRLVLALCVGLLGAVSSHADVIYDNGDPNGKIVASSTYFATVLDDFVLQPGASTITDFHWYGSYFHDVPAEDDFTIYIFDDSFNLIETIDGSATVRTATGNTVTIPIIGGEFDEYFYELDASPITLTAGETYYLGIANDDEFYWAWEQVSLLSGGSLVWLQDFDLFIGTNQDYAFQITGPSVVPEPATLTLVGLGLVGMIARRKFFSK